MIVTADQEHGWHDLHVRAYAENRARRLGLGELRLALLPAVLYPDVAELPPPRAFPTEVSAAVAATAYVNHGRWVADCPTDGCEGALVVSPEDPHFYCPYCFNFSASCELVRVVFPAAATRRAIETELLKRPFRRTRNWEPHETLADLRRENLEHGITG